MLYMRCVSVVGISSHTSFSLRLTPFSEIKYVKKAQDRLELSSRTKKTSKDQLNRVKMKTNQRAKRGRWEIRSQKRKEKEHE